MFSEVWLQASRSCHEQAGYTCRTGIYEYLWSSGAFDSLPVAYGPHASCVDLSRSMGSDEILSIMLELCPKPAGVSQEQWNQELLLEAPSVLGFAHPRSPDDADPSEASSQEEKWENDSSQAIGSNSSGRTYFYCVVTLCSPSPALERMEPELASSDGLNLSRLRGCQSSELTPLAWSYLWREHCQQAGWSLMHCFRCWMCFPPSSDLFRSAWRKGHGFFPISFSMGGYVQ